VLQIPPNAPQERTLLILTTGVPFNGQMAPRSFEEKGLTVFRKSPAMAAYPNLEQTILLF
jgi:hypothetical protein